MLSNNSIIHLCQLQEHFQLQKSGGYQVDNLEAGTKLWDVFKVKSAPEQKQENKCATLSINEHATQSQHECFPSATSSEEMTFFAPNKGVHHIADLTMLPTSFQIICIVRCQHVVHIQFVWGWQPYRLAITYISLLKTSRHCPQQKPFCQRGG